MHYSSSTLLPAFLSLALLSSATPTPVSPRGACTTVQPDILQIFSEAAPTTSFPNLANAGGNFVVSQDAGGVNRIYQAVGFSDIPAGSWGCSLNFVFPAGSSITTIGNPVLNVSTIDNGYSGNIVEPNNWTWDDLYSTPSPIDVELFGTVGEFDPTTVHTINSESCPTDLNGGGNLGFLFSIASWVQGDAAVYFNNLDTPYLSGVYLTYNC
jgi:hypothetical protein